MNLDFLPREILSALEYADINKIFDIRLRKGYPVTVNYYGSKKFLNVKGLSENSCGAIICMGQTIAQIMSALTENSVYAFNEQIKKGFLSWRGGVRVGIGGECVFDCGKIVTIKNVSSLNVRIPHEVTGCAQPIYDKLFNKEVLNTLIVSPPGFGKTTVLKDLIRLFDLAAYTVTVIDERGEFSLVRGNYVDTISYSDKLYAFEYGIRSLSPDIVVTDELGGVDDWCCAEKAAFCGVKIIASCHGKNAEDILKKGNFKKGVFERYVVLKSVDMPSVVDKYYDGEFNLI